MSVAVYGEVLNKSVTPSLCAKDEVSKTKCQQRQKESVDEG